MTIVSIGSTTGSITQVNAPGSTAGFVESVGDQGEGSVTGTLSRATIIAYNGDTREIIADPTLVPIGFEALLGTTLYGFRVVLDGVDVTDRVGEDITILYELDRLTSAELILHGKEFSFVVTEDTWTRTSLEIYYTQGPPGQTIEVRRFSGYVYRGTSEDDLSYRITALDLGLIASKNKVCLELDPELGLTRDTIAKDVLTTAGFLSVDFPTMQVYNKPFNFTGNSWGGVIEFVEPEGFHLRVTTDGAVEAYTIRIQDPPHHRWDVAEMLERPKITPPDSVESIFIFRGDVAAEETVTEGVSIEIRSTPIFGIVNRQTTHQQDASGNITERNFAVGTPHSSFTQLQLVKIVESEIHKVGTRTIVKIEREYGLKNPASARYETVSGAAGPGPQGTNFVPCYVLGSDFLVWPSSKFVQTLERREEFLYDSNETDIGSNIDSFEYFRKTQGVQTPAGNPIIGVYVGADNLSYDRNGPSLYQIEGFGHASRFELGRTYNVDTGAQAGELQTTYGWYSIKRDIDNGYVLFDGSAQDDQIAFFQLIEITSKPLVIDASGRKVGEIEVRNEYHVTESVLGLFDWGAHAAEAETEVFRTTGIEATSFDALNSSFFSRTTYTGTGRRRQENFPGRPPVPRYEASSFTRYQSAPIEVIVDDPLVESWFGRRTKVVQVRHAITLQELADILTRRRSRALSFQVRVLRHETLTRIGDSVLLTDNEQGLFHVGVVISVRDVRVASMSTSEYFLEIPLIDTGLPL